MMSYYYVIRGAVNGGFWSRSYSEFKGYVFATKYKSENSPKLIEDLEIARSKPCFIQKIYSND